MLRKLLLIYVCMLLPLYMAAQAFVQFPKKVHDFGIVPENADSVTCVFDVVNVGDSPMSVEGVYVSCGCTVATYSKEVIAPGEKGAVFVTFFPRNREGLYLKTIYVYTNTNPRKNIVRVKARVVPCKEN